MIETMSVTGKNLHNLSSVQNIYKYFIGQGGPGSETYKARRERDQARNVVEVNNMHLLFESYTGMHGPVWKKIAVDKLAANETGKKTQNAVEQIMVEDERLVKRALLLGALVTTMNRHAAKHDQSTVERWANKPENQPLIEVADVDPEYRSFVDPEVLPDANDIIAEACGTIAVEKGGEVDTAELRMEALPLARQKAYTEILAEMDEKQLLDADVAVKLVQ